MRRSNYVITEQQMFVIKKEIEPIKSILQNGPAEIIYRNCWTILRTGLYRAEGPNRPYLVLTPYTPRTRYLPRSSKVTRQSPMPMLC